jgi:hypothetical protein
MNYNISRLNMKINFKSKSFYPNYLALIISLLLILKRSYLYQSVLLRKSRDNTCIKFWKTRDSLLSFFIVDQYMGGWKKTSTLVVTSKVQRFPYFRSKMETALAASPTLSGHLTLRMLVIVLRCCSTYLNNVASPH